MGWLVRRSKTKMIAEYIRKGIAKETGKDVLDIPLMYIEEIVHNIVDEHNTIMTTTSDKKKMFNTGRMIARLFKGIYSDNERKILDEEIVEEEKQKPVKVIKTKENEVNDDEYLTEEEVKKMLNMENGE